MLINATPSWRGTSGAIFRSGDEILKYVAGLVFTDWRPQGIMLHNTAAPTQKQWDATILTDNPLDDARQRALNLTSYYRDEQKWQGGPHLFITDKLIMEFNPLTKRGTHSPNYNATHYGIEVVGDFNVDTWDGGRRDLTVQAVAAICSVRGFDPRQLKMHYDDPAGHQDCPGRFMREARGAIINAVLAKMAEGDFNGHVVETTVTEAPKPAVDFKTAIEHLQTAMNELGIRNAKGDAISVDGDPGPETRAAMLDMLKRLGGS